MLAQRWGLLRKHPSIISWAHTKILFKHFPNPAIIYNRINLVGKICKNGHARKKKISRLLQKFWHFGASSTYPVEFKLFLK